MHTTVVTDVFLLAFAFTIVLRVRQVSATGTASESERRFKRGNYICLALSAYSFSILALTLSTLPVWNRDGAYPGIDVGAGLLLLPLLITAPWIVWSFSAGQGGCRRAATIFRRQTFLEAQAGDGTPDECWKLGGLIYFNPADPSFLVETRIGVGWDVNVGNRWGLTLFIFAGLALTASLVWLAL